MKTFTLKSDTKLLSLNQAFVTMPNGRRCRSKAYTAFANRIKTLLNEQNGAFKAFEKEFQPKTHALVGKLEIGVKGMITKCGAISKNSMDLDNSIKCLVDNVLVGSIDDSQIVKWELVKFDAEIDSFCLKLEIIERSPSGRDF